MRRSSPPYIPRQMTLARPKTAVTVGPLTVTGPLQNPDEVADVIGIPEVDETAHDYELATFDGINGSLLTVSKTGQYWLEGSNIDVVEEAHQQFLEYLLLAGEDATDVAIQTGTDSVTASRKGKKALYQALNSHVENDSDGSIGPFEGITSRCGSGSAIEASLRVGANTIPVRVYSDGVQVYSDAKSITLLDTGVKQVTLWEGYINQ